MADSLSNCRPKKLVFTRARTKHAKKNNKKLFCQKLTFKTF